MKFLCYGALLTSIALVGYVSRPIAHDVENDDNTVRSHHFDPSSTAGRLHSAVGSLHDAIGGLEGLSGDYADECEHLRSLAGELNSAVNQGYDEVYKALMTSLQLLRLCRENDIAMFDLVEDDVSFEYRDKMPAGLLSYGVRDQVFVLNFEGGSSTLFDIPDSPGEALDKVPDVSHVFGGDMLYFDIAGDNARLMCPIESRVHVDLNKGIYDVLGIASIYGVETRVIVGDSQLSLDQFMNGFTVVGRPDSMEYMIEVDYSSKEGERVKEYFYLTARGR